MGYYTDNNLEVQSKAYIFASTNPEAIECERVGPSLSWMAKLIREKHEKVFIHWSKELRIKNTTKERPPVKVAVLANNLFYFLASRNNYVYLPSYF